jgi:hypothetical protein
MKIGGETVVNQRLFTVCDVDFLKGGLIKEEK